MIVRVNAIELATQLAEEAAQNPVHKDHNGQPLPFHKQVQYHYDYYFKMITNAHIEEEVKNE